MTISIHAPRTGSDASSETVGVSVLISIHAPRTGSDALDAIPGCAEGDFNPRSPHGERHAFVDEACLSDISIHAPRTGSDVAQQFSIYFKNPFQSTLPARGATLHSISVNTPEEHFNPRSPHGERRRLPRCNPTDKNFNPRSPHGERRNICMHSKKNSVFQSTLPARGATNRGNPNVTVVSISIHAPRTGSDG